MLSVYRLIHKDDINIGVQSDKNSTIRINLVNQFGQIIDTRLADIGTGYSQTHILIDPNLLSKGMYMLVISDDNGFKHIQRMLHIK